MSVPTPRSLKATRHALALATVTLLGGFATSAQAANCTWNTASGNWAAIVNWAACASGTPGAADTASIGAAGVVTVNTAQTIGTLNNAGSLTIDGSLLRATGAVNGPGTTTIQGGSLLNLEATQTVGGNATIVFGSGVNNRVGIDGGNKTVTLAAGTTVRGQSGSIGLGQLVNGSGNSVLNQGLISSDSGGTISIVQSGLTNQAVAEATGAGSVLSLQSTVNNTGGTLRATAGGVVQQAGAAVTGGSISNSGGGTYRPSNNANNYLNGVAVTGGSFIDMASAVSIARVTSGMTLNGTVNLNAGSMLNFEGSQTLTGSGSIVFGSTASSNRIGIDGGNKTLTIDSGISIRGENGVIGLGQLVNGSGNALINKGNITADVGGGTIIIAGLTSGVTNNGTIGAANGGTLALQSNLTGGAGSQLVAGAGSVVSQQGVTISGVVNTSGTGSLRPTNNANNYFSGVNFSGTLDMAGALAIERVVGGLTLDGTVNLNSGSIINFEGNQTLGSSSSGTIVFGNTAANNRVGVDGGNKTLTIASGITIRGQNGNIGFGGLVNGSGNAIINNGTIRADVAGGTVTIAGLTSGITNNGTIGAANGGTLQLQSNLVGTPSGQLIAGPGSMILQQGVTISGVVNTSGGGSLRPSNSALNYLSGVTLNGNLDMAGAVATERVTGNLVLNGVIDINSASILNFEGNQTLSGTGSIVFGASASNNRMGLDGGNKTLTVANGITIRGQNGSIGLGQLVNGSGNTLVNQGLISSDSAGTINIAQATLANQSFAEAVGAGSVLRLDSTVNNTGGTLRSSSGGVVLQNSVAVTGGSLSNTTGGIYRLSNSADNYLSGVTLTSGSAIDMASAAALGRVVNGMVLDGNIALDAGNLLNMEGTQTLAGNGAIVFGGGANNRVGVDGGNKTLTIASGVTLQGQNGSIGVGSLINGSGNAIVNNGNIQSDGGGTIVIQGLTSGLQNNGLLRAQNGTLNVSTSLAGSGTLQVDAAGVMSLANGAKAQGTLAMGAAGAALNLGTGNLTIASDYTNGAWGSGNSFARRAGITGTGLIVAAGDVVQQITGVGVAGGNTADATLTIGNLRVGSTTFNYQIANAGTTGPALRGAIQTGVNGGALTDARLSGLGATAGNYSTGGPGMNSGDLGVRFSVASAGNIAPLTGQVLNLRSNFENIADQRLNIVLAAGAAAYNAAVGSASPAPVQLAAQRLGGSLSQAITVSNLAPGGAFSEDLNASIGSSTGSATMSGGPISGLLAGSSNSSAVRIGLNTGSSGALSGTATLAYATAGAVGGVSNGLGVASAGRQVINVRGNVYAPAVAQLDTPAVNFGIVRVSDAVAAQNLVVANAASGALTDTLRAEVSGGNASFTTSGTASGIAAGASNASSLSVALNTAVAGVYNSSGMVSFISQNPEMSDSPLGTALVSLSAQVNNLAATTLAHDGAGSFSGGLLSYTLNFGTVLTGASGGTARLSLSNSATGPADALAGQFDLSALMGGDPFALGGFSNFSGLAAGSSPTALTVRFGGNVEGSFDRMVLLNRLSTNGSGPDLALAAVELRLIGSVAAIPEPGTWAMWLAGLAALGSLVRRRARSA